MATITLQDMQRDPLGYLHRVEAGETLVILRDDRAVAEIKPVARPNAARRPRGLCAGQFTVPDDFNAPLPEEILKEFEGT